jgi:hypothetical protein
MFDRIRRASPACFALVLTVALTSSILSAQQELGSSALGNSVMRLASQGQFDAADRAMEASLASTQPDYDVFWEYQAYLVNQTGRSQEDRAARLGQKWLPVVRKAPPPARGRIMKETAVGILFGPFSRTHSRADLTAARTLLEDAVQANPQLCEAYLHLALIAALEGQLPAALTMLDRTVETSVDDEQRSQFISLRDQARKDPSYLVTVARRMYGIAQ